MIDRQHSIIVVIIRSDTTNEMLDIHNNIILGCERGGNYKNKGKLIVTYRKRVKYQFSVEIYVKWLWLGYIWYSQP